MSKNTEVMRSVSNLVNFIKEKTAQNINEASQKGSISGNRDEVSKIIQLVQDSISQAYTIGVSSVEKTLTK